MSSLNATQADGYYIPPDYLNSGAYKKKSLNQFNKNKGHNQYLLNSVVRFEFPYDGFCQNKDCGAHVGKGTRFNAHKEHVGDYFTTKIWEFTMKCRACSESTFVIRTNPKERCFDYCSGIKRKVEEFDTVNAGSLGVIDTDFGNGIHTYSDIKGINAQDNTLSAIDKLQKEKVGERKAMTERDAMQILVQYNDSTMLDDAMSNSKLRSNYRKVRKAKKRRLDHAKSKGLGMGIELSTSTKVDSALARSAFNDKSRDMKSRKVEKQKFRKLRASSIFKTNNSDPKHRKQSPQRKAKIDAAAINAADKLKQPKKIVLSVQNGGIVKKTSGGIREEDEKKSREKNSCNELSHLMDVYDSDSSAD